MYELGPASGASRICRHRKPLRLHVANPLEYRLQPVTHRNPRPKRRNRLKAVLQPSLAPQAVPQVLRIHSAVPLEYRLQPVTHRTPRPERCSRLKAVFQPSLARQAVPQVLRIHSAVPLEYRLQPVTHRTPRPKRRNRLQAVLQPSLARQTLLLIIRERMSRNPVSLVFPVQNRGHLQGSILPQIYLAAVDHSGTPDASGSRSLVARV